MSEARIKAALQKNAAIITTTKTTVKELAPESYAQIETTTAKIQLENGTFEEFYTVQVTQDLGDSDRPVSPVQTRKLR